GQGQQARKDLPTCRQLSTAMASLPRKGSLQPRPANGRRQNRRGFSLSFAADKVDQGRHPGMPGAFVDHAVMLADLDRGEIAEGRFEQASVIEIRDRRGSPRRVVELFGPVALHQQQPARLQRTLYPRKDFLSERRIGKLDEDRRDQVERGNRPPPLREV